MKKYRGKYKKYRTCKHADKTGLMEYMILVPVLETCPKMKRLLSGNFADKVICENCEAWEGSQ